MAFRRFRSSKRKIQLISLIDLIFILLLFFIVTSVLVKISKGESKIFIPTPKNEPGEAQVLIQILDRERFLWIDYTAIDTLNRYRYLLSDRADSRAKLDLIAKKMTIDGESLTQRLKSLKRHLLRKRTDAYFVIIRCPNRLPYYLPLKIIEQLVGIPNLEYGCVSGTIEEMRNSENIVIERNLIQIDF
ncbi:MAG: biopolymer transporter ExbD [bacterium]